MIVSQEVVTLCLVEDNKSWNQPKGNFPSETDDECVETGMGEGVVYGQEHLPPKDIDEKLVDIGWPDKMDDIVVASYQKQQEQEIGPKGLDLP